MYLANVIPLQTSLVGVVAFMLTAGVGAFTLTAGVGAFILITA